MEFSSRVPLRGCVKEEVTALKWSNLGNFLAVGTEIGDLFIYEIAQIAKWTPENSDGVQPTRTFKRIASEAIASICWAPVDSPTAPESTLHFATGHSVVSVDVSPVAEGAEDKPSTRVTEVPKVDADDEINSISINKKGVLAVASDSNRVTLLTPSPGPGLPIFKLTKTLEAHNNIVSTVAFRHKKPELLSGGLDSKLIRWELSSGRVQHTWTPETWAVSTAPAGEDAAQQRVVMTPPLVQCMAENPSDDPRLGSLVALGLADTSVVIMDVDYHTKTRAARRAGPSTGKKRMAAESLACTDSGFVCCLSVEQSLEGGGHTDGITGVAFLSGNLVVSGSTDRRVLLWVLGEAVTEGENYSSIRGRVASTSEEKAKVTQIATAPFPIRMPAPPSPDGKPQVQPCFLVAVGHTKGSELAVLRVMPAAKQA